MTDEEVRKIKEFIRLKEIDDNDNSQEMIDEVFENVMLEFVDRKTKIKDN